jgi:hypothetical protein
MTEAASRELKVSGGRVECRPGTFVEIDRCRFCACSREFCEAGMWKQSPALAYCMRSRTTEGVDLERVSAVRCSDRTGEGFRSIMSIIS